MRLLARAFAATVLAAILAHGAWTFARQAGAQVRSPWSRDYGEGCTLALGALLSERGSYFPALVDYPYLVANYPPVFPALEALGQQLLGPTLFFPRLVAFGATLSLVLLLFLVLRVLLGDRAQALCLALVFVMPWFVTTWAALARVDTLALAFSLAGLLIVLRRDSQALPWPALACFWLAFFTKQSMLAAPAAVLLELALRRDRRFGRALLSYALPLAALVALLVLATHGAAFRHLVVYTAAASYEWDRMLQSYLQLAVIAGPLLVLIALTLVARVASAQERAGRILLLYLALSLAGFVAIAKSGAAQNYFLEPWLATILAAGWALRGLRERVPGLGAYWAAWLAIVAAVAQYSYSSQRWLPQPLRAPDRARYFTELTRLVHETPGPVLCENLSLLVLDGRPVLLEPYGVQLIAEAGLFDTSRLTRDCEAGRFPLVVVEYRMWQIPGFGACLERAYEPVAQLGPYEVLRPRATRTRHHE